MMRHTLASWPSCLHHRQCGACSLGCFQGKQEFTKDSNVAVASVRFLFLSFSFSWRRIA